MIILPLLLCGCSDQSESASISGFSKNADVVFGDFSYTCVVVYNGSTVTVSAQSTAAAGLVLFCFAAAAGLLLLCGTRKKIADNNAQPAAPKRAAGIQKRRYPQGWRHFGCIWESAETPKGVITGLPKIAAKRDFWEEERQALQARRQTQRADCHGALPATSRRGVASLYCRFPSGASAKRRGRWPLARTNQHPEQKIKIPALREADGRSRARTLRVRFQRAFLLTDIRSREGA